MDGPSLSKLLDIHFTLGELRQICFKLDIDYENIAGDVKTDKALNLVIYCLRREKIQDLITAVISHRPNLKSILDSPFRYPDSQTFAGENLSIPWNDVKQICLEKNERHLNLLLDKYIPELYVERQGLKKHINKFMESQEIHYLILKGRSGTGKTGFISNLERAYRKDENKACLVFECKSLRLTKEIATSDLLDSLAAGWLPKPDPRVIAGMLKRISEGKNFDARKNRLVIMVDAINEAENMEAVIEWLSYLQYDDRQPWVKVIISCRPHVWKKLKHALFVKFRLSRNYFYRPDDIGQEFVEVGNFTNDEAREAYKKHQQKFNLQPKEFFSLDPLVQKRLKEPLLLFLTSHICEDGKEKVTREIVGTDLSVIPRYTKTRLAVDIQRGFKRKGYDYVDSEVSDEVNTVELFLKEILTRKMIDQGKCHNTIPFDTVAKLSPEALNRCLELGLLEKTAKGTFQTSLEGGRMSQEGNHTSQRNAVLDDKIWIGFRYERFYDYYFGHEIRRQANLDNTLDCAPERF